MADILIKRFPHELYERVQKLALLWNLSVNQTLVRLLKTGVKRGIETQMRERKLNRTHRRLKLYGRATNIDYEEVERFFASQRLLKSNILLKTKRI